MKKENVLLEKSFQLALEAVKIYKLLLEDKLFDIARQVLKSGTSVGANVNEAQGAESKKDFIHKLSIAHKESIELEFWIKLIVHSELISREKITVFYKLNDETKKILSSVLITTKNKYLKK